MAMIQRRTAAETKGTTTVNPPYDSSTGMGQATWEFLTTVVWDEPAGKPRIPGTITLFGDAGRLKAVLNDKDAEMAAFVTLDPSSGVLEALEGALLSTETDWRKVARTGYQKK